VLQVDGYTGFEQLTAGGAIKLAACWAHTRRKFYEVAQATGSPIATEALRRIGDPYKIVEQVRGKSPALQFAERRTWSQPIINAFHPWRDRQLRQIPARSGLADATRSFVGML